MFVNLGFVCITCDKHEVHLHKMYLVNLQFEVNPKISNSKIKKVFKRGIS